MATRILLKTTIPATEDDWHIGRFSLLAAHLAAQADATGTPLYAVTPRDRDEDAQGNDRDLAALGGWDQLWLFAVDDTGALTEDDCAAIDAFRAAGGGVMLSRDHMNLGACLTRLGPIGELQHFQKVNPEADVARQCIDDVETAYITWPNYHSGANGDFQQIEAADHPVMRRADGTPIRTLPSHPHEGTVGVPEALAGFGQVVAQGRSQVTGRPFNLVVAVDEPGKGRVVAEGSFHHLCDYNWNPAMGCPSFVSEAPGRAILDDAEAAGDAREYAAAVARWLAGAHQDPAP
ncbi:hypothetical protein [Sphingomonas sp.]|uniref:hypothetical protein n=1 Tax=Sphingomonas sp. TaxID=28214 RepID=UPI001B002535|nr:hypothetical protein [Sphingomonas sp.]MBO9711431.1 hypothetical protein [Sphingomonas sp.]